MHSIHSIPVSIHVKPHPHQQQCQSIVECYKSNNSFDKAECCRFWQQCQTKFRPFDKVETNWTCSICLDYVGRTKFRWTLLPKPATLLPNIVAKNGNNVEATFDFAERTIFYYKLVRHCCHFPQQSRTLLQQSWTLLRLCCWCGRGLT